MSERSLITLSKLPTNEHTTVKMVPYLLIICIAVLVLIRDIGGIEMSRYIIIGIATLACLLSNKYGIYCMMAFIAPISAGVSYTYIAAIALVILLIKEKFRLKLHPIGLVCMLVILCLELVSAFRGMFSFLDYFRFTGIFLLAFLRMIDFDSGYPNDKILKYYLFGFFIVATSIIGQMLNYYSFSDFLNLGIRLGDTRQALDVTTEGMFVSYNSNGLGVLCLQAALLSLLQWKNRSKVYLIAFIGATLLGIMTQSRAFFLVYIIAIVLYVVFSQRTIKDAIQSLVFMTVGSITIFSLINLFIQKYVTGLSLRFQDDDVSGGRIQIMLDYFGEMFQHVDRVFIGVGLQNYQDKYGFWASAHNATQEVMIAWGIIGLLAVLLLFFCILRNARRQNPKALFVQYIPIIATLIYLQSVQGFLDTAGMLRMMVMYSVILIPMGNSSTINKTIKQGGVRL